MASVLQCTCLLLLASLLFGPAPPAEASGCADRIQDLLQQMSLEEKVSQLQTGAPGIPRLGLPAFEWWSEGLHGLINNEPEGATIFPSPLALGSTWDVNLVGRIGQAVSDEARAIDNKLRAQGRGAVHLNVFGPNINLARDARWGRINEVYAEDPVLMGKLSAAFVQGLQGQHPQYIQVGATCKHYMAYSLEEADGVTRHTFDARVDARDMKESYLPAFQACIQAGGARSVMCSYNKVNGVPMCANTKLLGSMRDDWGFTGFVASDCGAVTDVSETHRFVPNITAAVALTTRAGTDLNCDGAWHSLMEAVSSGLLSQAELDTAVSRVLAGRCERGALTMEPPEDMPWQDLGLDQVGSPEHLSLALEAGRKSVILLVNRAPRGLRPAAKTCRATTVSSPVVPPWMSAAASTSVPRATTPTATATSGHVTATTASTSASSAQTSSPSSSAAVKTPGVNAPSAATAASTPSASTAVSKPSSSSAAAAAAAAKKLPVATKSPAASAQAGPTPKASASVASSTGGQQQQQQQRHHQPKQRHDAQTGEQQQQQNNKQPRGHQQHQQGQHQHHQQQKVVVLGGDKGGTPVLIASASRTLQEAASTKVTQAATKVTQSATKVTQSDTTSNADHRENIKAEAGSQDGAAEVPNTDTPSSAARQLLPLKAGRLSRVLVLGYLADAPEHLLATYYGRPAGGKVVTPLQAITSYLSAKSPKTVVDYQQGANSLHPYNLDYIQAVTQKAECADVVIAVVGSSAINGREGPTGSGTVTPVMESEGLDRDTLLLQGHQADLVAAAARSGRPVVVVLVHGGPLDFSPLLKWPQVAAVLSLGYSGQQGALALPEILFGDVSPSGKTSVTWPFFNYTEQQPMTEMSMRAWPGRTYKYLQVPPLVPFAHGLSYTSFKSVNASMVPCTDDEGRALPFCFRLVVYIQNAGPMDSDLVVTAFITRNGTSSSISSTKVRTSADSDATVSSHVHPSDPLSSEEGMVSRSRSLLEAMSDSSTRNFQAQAGTSTPQLGASGRGSVNKRSSTAPRVSKSNRVVSSSKRRSTEIFGLGTANPGSTATSTCTAPDPPPSAQLVGFTRVTLARGETARFSMDLTSLHLSHMVMRDASGEACAVDPVTGMPALTSDQLQVVILDAVLPVDINALLPSDPALEVCRKRVIGEGREGRKGKRRGLCSNALRAHADLQDLSRFRAAQIQVG